MSRLAQAQLDGGGPDDAPVPATAADCEAATDDEHRGALKGSGAASAANPVILVLGETLQRLPLESMPCLRTNKHVSRMPALEHVFVRVRWHNSVWVLPVAPYTSAVAAGTLSIFILSDLYSCCVRHCNFVFRVTRRVLCASSSPSVQTENRRIVFGAPTTLPAREHWRLTPRAGAT